MTYNPKIHRRRSIRLHGYDYAQPGLYFITICCYDRACLFGEIITEENQPSPKMKLNDAGKIADRCWLEIPNHFPHAVLHEHVIMPNHVHGIIELVGAKNFSPNTNNNPNINDPADFTDNEATNNITGDHSPGNHPGNVGPNNLGNDHNIGIVGAKNFSPLRRSPSKTIGSIVRGFKIGVTKWIRQNAEIRNVWQRNYYEHIIRDEQSNQRISEYILNNPAKWQDDRSYSTSVT